MKNSMTKTIKSYSHDYNNMARFVGAQEHIAHGETYFGKKYQDKVLNDLLNQVNPKNSWDSKISHHIWVSDPINPRNIVSYRSDVKDDYNHLPTKERVAKSLAEDNNAFIQSVTNLVKGANDPAYNFMQAGSGKGWDHHIFWTNVDLDPIFAQRYLEKSDIDYATNLRTFYDLTEYGMLHRGIGDAIPNDKLPTTNLAFVDLSNENMPKIHVYQLNGPTLKDTIKTTYSFPSEELSTQASSVIKSSTNMEEILSGKKETSCKETGSSATCKATDDSLPKKHIESNSVFDTGFSHFLQNLQELKQVSFSCKTALEVKNTNFYALISDLWRILAVKEFGGIYFDIDYNLYDQVKIHENEKLSLFDLMKVAKSVHGEEWCVGLCNSFITANTPNNEIMIHAYNILKRNLGGDQNVIPDYVKYPQNTGHQILFTTGPTMLTVAYAKVAEKMEIANEVNPNIQAAFGKMYRGANDHSIEDNIGDFGYDSWGGSWAQSASSANNNPEHVDLWIE